MLLIVDTTTTTTPTNPKASAKKTELELGPQFLKFIAPPLVNANGGMSPLEKSQVNRKAVKE